MSETVTFSHISNAYRGYVSEIFERFWRVSRVKILVVVDTEISLTASPGAFGVGRVVELIRGASVGCMRFDVTLARRSAAPPGVNPSPAPDQPKYEGFRFDQKESDGTTYSVDLFDEIWCFGFKPGNDGGPDTNISQASAVPVTDSELKVVTRWMNESQGGVFATGDHDYLGASMCSRMPRIGTMRLWTNADGVPPIGGPDRIDTNRPATPGQADVAGTPDVMPFSNQSDAVPQQIEWVAWSIDRLTRFIVKRRPHPVLCHPKLGPIDVMPDHPHEGRCFDTHVDRRTGRAEINLGGTYAFDGFTGEDYPTKDGIRPTPLVIAYGTTLPDPPYNHEKQDSPFKRFPMISVYDGHQAEIGRVAVDSTWHHWMDQNLGDIEAASDKTAWEKISRYFVNLAVWLAPPSIPRRCFALHLFKNHFEYLGFREFSPRASIWDLGSAFKVELGRVYGPCWVTQFVFDWIWVSDRALSTRLREHYTGLPAGKRPKPRPDPCLSCPPLEMLENAVLGGIVRRSIDLVTPVRRELEARLDAVERPSGEGGAGQAVEFDFEEFEKSLIEGAANGLEELMRAMQESARYSRSLFNGTGKPTRG